MTFTTIKEFAKYYDALPVHIRGDVLLGLGKVADFYNARIKVCPQCRATFVKQDSRQKFCGPRCGAQSREDRFRERVGNISEYRSRMRYKRLKHTA